MVAIMGLKVQDGTVGSSLIALLKSGGLWGPSVNLFTKVAPSFMGTAMRALKPTGMAARTTMRAEP